MKDATDDILKATHEMARALHRVGAMDDITMREMDALCLPPKPAYTPAQIRRIRSETRMSQPVFARLLGVGKTAVAQWEQGERKPSGPALRLLEILDQRRPASPVVQLRKTIDRKASHTTSA